MCVKLTYLCQIKMRNSFYYLASSCFQNAFINSVYTMMFLLLHIIIFFENIGKTQQTLPSILYNNRHNKLKTTIILITRK